MSRRNRNPSGQWVGNNFYHLHGKRRDYIGSVIRVAFEDRWQVWLRGEPVEDAIFTSEKVARAALERCTHG